MDAIIQARLGSKRFPNKVLKNINEQPLLKYCVDQIKSSKKIKKIIIATTTNKIDDKLEKFSLDNNLLCYRGPENNVLDRFLFASKEYNLNKFIRVCSDNPLIDIDLLEKQIDLYGIDYDYCSYYTKYGEPVIIKPIGVFAEIVTIDALKKASFLGQDDPRTQEHVTFYIHSHPEVFKIKKLLIPEFINPELRLTIDYPEDIKVVEYIFNRISNFKIKNIIKLIDEDKNLGIMINNIIKQYPKIYN